MAETPSTHPLHLPQAPADRRRAIAAHPTAARHAVADAVADTATARPQPQSPPVLTVVGVHVDEDGSMATEYGLITVVGATIASLCINWASGGGIYDLLGKVMNRIASLLF